MKKHFVPVREVPIFFYLRSCSEVVNTINGFKIIRVTAFDKVVYYYQLGKHLWKLAKN